MSIRQIIIVDKHDSTDLFKAKKYYWNGRDNDIYSIANHLEKYSDKFRSKYLDFVENLKYKKINDKSLYSLLDLDEGLNFWWMTLVAEKSTYKSPHIFDCLKLLALEDILLNHKPEKVIITTSNKMLAESISILCNNLEIVFFWQRRGQKHKKTISAYVPNLLKAIKWLTVYIIKRKRLKNAHNNKMFKKDNTVTMISYFYHLDKIKADNNKFYSHQWEILPQIIHDSGLTSNWLHMFSISSALPNAQRALDLALKFNKYSKTNGYHGFIDGYQSYNTILKSIKYFIRLLFIAPRLIYLKDYFYANSSSACLWPFLKNDWKSSIIGEVAIQNCLYASLFDSAFEKLPKQKLGMFLYENQNWESALIQAWRKHGHGKLIAVPHATIRYWDLMYFREYYNENSNKLKMQSPDIIAINGVFSRDTLSNAVKNPGNLIEVEALRYLYLTKVRTKKSIESRGSNKIRMLILGDLKHDKTSDMLVLAHEAITSLKTINLEVVLKTHPNCPMDSISFLPKYIKTSASPLELQMNQSDIIFCANSTSAVLDGALMNLSIVIMSDQNDFNNSPLRDIKGVKFIKNPEDLVKILAQPRAYKPSIEINKIFFLDKNLPRWKDVISKIINEN